MERKVSMAVDVWRGDGKETINEGDEWKADGRKPSMAGDVWIGNGKETINDG
jgi:hypothetical protein